MATAIQQNKEGKKDKNKEKAYDGEGERNPREEKSSKKAARSQEVGQESSEEMFFFFFSGQENPRRRRRKKVRQRRAGAQKKWERGEKKAGPAAAPIRLQTCRTGKPAAPRPTAPRPVATQKRAAPVAQRRAPRLPAPEIRHPTVGGSPVPGRIESAPVLGVGPPVSHDDPTTSGGSLRITVRPSVWGAAAIVRCGPFAFGGRRAQRPGGLI